MPARKPQLPCDLKKSKSRERSRSLYARSVANQLLFDAERFQEVVIQRAIGDGNDPAAYRELRATLLASAVKALVPEFIVKCRDLNQFWGFIQPLYAHYKERKAFIWEAFRPMMEQLESGLGAPVVDVASEKIAKLDAAHVRGHWEKALSRSADDPEGAITAARTLVESVCKLILDAQNVTYENDGDLPSLYKTTARSLKLAVDQHGEQVFKQILTGCASVINGFASVRNSLGDAHGQGAKPVRPAPRHAQLAVNLAGTMATFLLETFEAHHGKALHRQDEPSF